MITVGDLSIIPNDVTYDIQQTATTVDTLDYEDDKDDVNLTTNYKLYTTFILG